MTFDEILSSTHVLELIKVFLARKLESAVTKVVVTTAQ
jgi:hypothetical protein